MRTLEAQTATYLLLSINCGVIKKFGECLMLSDKLRIDLDFRILYIWVSASFSCGWWFIMKWWTLAIGPIQQNKTRIMHLCLVFVLQESRCVTDSYSFVVCHWLYVFSFDGFLTLNDITHISWQHLG